MAVLKRRKIETIDEQRIVTGMIVSREYMEKVYDFLDLDYFQSPHTQVVAKWCIEYYETHLEASFPHIQDMYNLEKGKMREEDAEMVKDFLLIINEQYQAVGGINAEYLLTQTLKWCKTRKMEITLQRVKIRMDVGDLPGAEREFKEFEVVQAQTARFTTMGDEEIVSQIVAQQELDNFFFKFPGALGYFLGDLKRGWLVGIAGAFKRGKTWLAMEFAIIGMLSFKKVAFFSLEMSEIEMWTRVYKRLTAAGEKKGLHLFPVIDCLHNQTGDCNLQQRVNNISLTFGPNGELPDHDPSIPYKACTACRNTRDRNQFLASHWWEEINRPEFDFQTINSQREALLKQYGNNIMVRNYPRMGANIFDIESDLHLMEQVHNFVPDIIIIDYADILKAEDELSVGVDKEDRTWMALAALAQKRSALVVVPTQVTRAALDAIRTTQSHMAKWIGKLAHVDVMAALNQTEEQKRNGVMRVGLLAHRHQDFQLSNDVSILQKLDLGQVALDSEFIRPRQTSAEGRDE